MEFRMFLSSSKWATSLRTRGPLCSSTSLCTSGSVLASTLWLSLYRWSEKMRAALQWYGGSRTLGHSWWLKEKGDSGLLSSKPCYQKNPGSVQACSLALTKFEGDDCFCLGFSFWICFGGGRREENDVEVISMVLWRKWFELVLYLRCSVSISKVAEFILGIYLTLPMQQEKEALWRVGKY